MRDHLPAVAAAAGRGKNPGSEQMDALYGAVLMVAYNMFALGYSIGQAKEAP